VQNESSLNVSKSKLSGYSTQLYIEIKITGLTTPHHRTRTTFTYTARCFWWNPLPIL